MKNRAFSGGVGGVETFSDAKHKQKNLSTWKRRRRTNSYAKCGPNPEDNEGRCNLQDWGKDQELIHLVSNYCIKQVLGLTTSTATWSVFMISWHARVSSDTAVWRRTSLSFKVCVRKCAWGSVAVSTEIINLINIDKRWQRKSQCTLIKLLLGGMCPLVHSNCT